MPLLVLGFIANLVPSLAIFFWFKNYMKPDNQEFKAECNKAFKYGFLSVIAVLGVSLVFTLIKAALKLDKINFFLERAFYKFIVLALAEELVKYFTFRKLEKSSTFKYTWLDCIIFMTIVGLAFGVAEDIPYAIGSGPIHMIIRGVTAMHLGYGFILGYFIGKARYTGKKSYLIIGFIIPWLLHGLYDFGLTPELLDLGDQVAIISVSLAVFAFITLIFLIFFMRKAKDDPKYNEELIHS